MKEKKLAKFTKQLFPQKIEIKIEFPHKYYDLEANQFIDAATIQPEDRRKLGRVPISDTTPSVIPAKAGIQGAPQSKDQLAFRSDLF